MFDPETTIYYLTYIPSIVVAITCHEFAHARVALAFGDTTALEEGRVSLNPLVHLDPIGTLGIIFAGFGWGRPVPVNRSFLRHPRADLLVSAAGPLTNLLLAVLGALVIQVPLVSRALEMFGIASGAHLLGFTFVRLNVGLALFNLLPIFPLDGSHVLENLLPLERALRFQQFNQAYGSWILIALMLSGRVLPVSLLSLVLGPPMQFLLSLLLKT